MFIALFSVTHPEAHFLGPPPHNFWTLISPPSTAACFQHQVYFSAAQQKHWLPQSENLSCISCFLTGSTVSCFFTFSAFSVAVAATFDLPEAAVFSTCFQLVSWLNYNCNQSLTRAALHRYRLFVSFKKNCSLPQSQYFIRQAIACTSFLADNLRF